MMRKLMLGGAGDDELIDADGTQRKKSKKSKNKNKNNKRFSDEQIKSLESVFKMEKKLEPRKKLEMATELGLHPRQVGIWFQNRRARWKSKQVEHDYTSLKADYHSLTHRFHSLNKEKHALLQQLRDLCCQLSLKEGSKDLETSSTGPEYGGDTKQKEEVPIPTAGNRKEFIESENVNVFTEEALIYDHEKAINFDPSNLFHQSLCSNSNRWDIWS